jgi:tetratricopeptide (TPR) repeat protein
MNDDSGRLEADNLDENRASSMTADQTCISVARKKWEDDQDNNSSRLQYGALLAESSCPQDTAEAILHLQFLMEASYSLRDTLFYLSVLYYYRGDFESARVYSEELYKIDPDSKQIKDLHRAICYKSRQSDKKTERERQETALTAAGILALGIVSVGLGIIFSSKRK